MSCKFSGFHGGCYWPYGFNVFVATFRREDNWNLVQVDSQIQTSGGGTQRVPPKLQDKNSTLDGVKPHQDVA